MHNDAPHRNSPARRRACWRERCGHDVRIPGSGNISELPFSSKAMAIHASLNAHLLHARLRIDL